MLKVAIVRCGKIADSHASQIQRIKGCEIVGVCEREPLMTQQLFKRFPIKRCFSDVTKLLSEAQPNIVHITTPPQSPFEIAKACLEWGCHMYVEKPFTVWEEEARKLIGLANEEGLKITAGHDDHGPLYHSIRQDALVPIPYREILLTTNIMDATYGSSMPAGRGTISHFKHEVICYCI